MTNTEYNSIVLDKVSWYDNLRVIATIGVIGIHVSSPYRPSTGSISEYDFWIGNIFDSLSRFAVPVFVMLSGALLLSKEYEIGVFLKKRLSRLLFPFLFWSMIYSLNTLWNNYDSLTELSVSDFIQTVLTDYRDGSAVHFWYIYMIVGLYLFVPIIGKWVRNATEKEMLYFLAIWIFTLFFDQPFLETFKPHIDFSYFTGFLGYLVLGYYLRVKIFKNKSQQNLFAWLFLSVGIVTTILGTYFLHYFYGEYSNQFYDPLAPNVMLYSCGLFLLFKDKYISCNWLIVVRDFVSKYSYGIFLIHILIFKQLVAYGIDWQFIDPIIGIPFTILSCLILSSAIIFIINKLPYGKYISG